MNLDSSWLSREILFAGGFFVLWIVSYYLDRKGAWNQIVGWVTSIVGLGAVFSMASIYFVTIKPAWIDVNTYLVFFGTTVVFGAVAVIMVVLQSKEEKTEALMKVLKVFGLAGLAAIVIQLIYLPVYAAGLSVDGGLAGAETASLFAGKYAYSIIIRWILSITGLAIIGLIFYKNIKPQTQCKICYAAFALVIIGEFLGRFIFYGTGVSMIVG
ncbi:dimethyl sulfoxide reductase anchor subunit family protein [Bacillus salinus]|uniref:dimethyl sulfoxide reductase anchor subunit family protein n=1 Tax=Bacillus sp. HMF5848 TaxID=2495421 RepID=UPI0021ADB64E|nr:DmsC/YnfH family molybdoenzyme membrane anchor subunit [Bacillus sp. HMF5848]